MLVKSYVLSVDCLIIREDCGNRNTCLPQGGQSCLTTRILFWTKQTILKRYLPTLRDKVKILKSQKSLSLPGHC